MSASMVLLFALGIGVVAGLRAMTAPAVVAWAAHLGWLNLAGSYFAFMGSKWAVAIFTLAALGELVNDQLPKTPARTTGGASDGAHCDGRAHRRVPGGCGRSLSHGGSAAGRDRRGDRNFCGIQSAGWTGEESRCS